MNKENGVQKAKNLIKNWAEDMNRYYEGNKDNILIRIFYLYYSDNDLSSKILNIFKNLSITKIRWHQFILPPVEYKSGCLTAFISSITII